MKAKILINGEECVKFGKDIKGNQRYKRKSDGKIVNEHVKKRCNNEIKILAIFLYYRGLTLSCIGDMFGVSYNTIANWINNIASEILKYNVTDIQSVKDVEIDEIYHYLNNKKKDYTFLQPLIENHTKSLTLK